MKITAAPKSLDLELYRGDDFALTFRSAVDMVDWTWKGQLRPSDGTVALLAEMTPTPIVDGGGEVHEVRLALSGAQTGTLPDRWVWDIERTRDGLKKTLVAGSGTAVGDVSE